ncbi:MAG TPA: hypothetical protein VM598_02710 [Bdellovibrionota bacterium]|nr:hypothetical protein [Bdellovibrionota bacterium]
MSVSIGLGSIARKDTSGMRRYFFERLLEANWMARLAFRAYGHPHLRPLVSRALVLRPLVRVLSAGLEIPPNVARIDVYNYSNERRALAAFRDGQDGARGFISYRWSLSGFLHGSAWLAGRLWNARKARQAFRVSLRAVKKRGFLVGGRQAEFLLLYAYFHDRLAKAGVRGKTFACSTESNPEVIAALLAARGLGNRTTYVDHGFLDKDLGIFFHDRLVLSSEALLGRIETRLLPGLRPTVGWARSRNETRGLRIPDFRAIRHVGIVCSIAMIRENYLRVVSECLAEFPAALISVKPHPNPAFTGSFFRKLPEHGRVRILPAKASLSEAAESWDFAIGGGTCAHLELLQAGIPSIYMDIDGYERDTKGFIGSGILAEARSASEIATLIPETYGSAGWRDRFSRFSEVPRGNDPQHQETSL